MIVSLLSFLLSTSNVMASNCQAQDSLFYEGECYQKTSPVDCSIHSNYIELKNTCYKPEKPTETVCNAEFNLSINDQFCVDTSTFSDSKQIEMFKNNKKYSIQVRLVPKNISVEEAAQTANWYLSHVFKTYTYEDQIDPNENLNYSFSAPVDLKDSEFKLYDQKIAPELFSTIHQNIEKQQSHQFEVSSESQSLFNNSKLNLAKALESVFSKYGSELDKYNIFIGVQSEDEDGNNKSSVAGIGFPTSNGQFEIKVFSSEKPKHDLDISTTLESKTGFEVGLLNINSGHYVIDVYGNVHNIEESLLDESNPTDAELEKLKGWVLGTRIKPSKNLDLSVEFSESKSANEDVNHQPDTFNEKPREKKDMQFWLSISYKI